jgi:hypothetical protein
MDIATLIQLATLVSLVVGVVGLMISVRGYRRQVNAQFLLEYTKRVSEVLLSLPPSILPAHMGGPGTDVPETTDEVRRGVLRCLALFSQLQFFSRQGFIPRHVWRRNHFLFDQILASPLFVREWKTFAPLFANDPGFVRYVEKAQREAQAPSVPAARIAG